MTTDHQIALSAKSTWDTLSDETRKSIREALWRGYLISDCRNSANLTQKRDHDAANLLKRYVGNPRGFANIMTLAYYDGDFRRIYADLGYVHIPDVQKLYHAVTGRSMTYSTYDKSLSGILELCESRPLPSPIKSILVAPRPDQQILSYLPVSLMVL